MSLNIPNANRYIDMFRVAANEHTFVNSGLKLLHCERNEMMFCNICINYKPNYTVRSTTPSNSNFQILLEAI